MFLEVKQAPRPLKQLAFGTQPRSWHAKEEEINSSGVRLPSFLDVLTEKEV